MHAWRRLGKKKSNKTESGESCKQLKEPLAELTLKASCCLPLLRSSRRPPLAKGWTGGAIPHTRNGFLCPPTLFCVATTATADIPHPPPPPDQGLMSRLSLASTKAGMDGVDQNHANGVILKASEGSRFYLNEARKERKTATRVNEMKRRAAAIRQSQLEEVESQLDADVAGLERKRDLSRILVHIDADAFYATVEELERPELKNVPMAGRARPGGWSRGCRCGQGLP